MPRPGKNPRNRYRAAAMENGIFQSAKFLWNFSPRCVNGDTLGVTALNMKKRRTPAGWWKTSVLSWFIKENQLRRPMCLLGMAFILALYPFPDLDRSAVSAADIPVPGLAYVAHAPRSEKEVYAPRKRPLQYWKDAKAQEQMAENAARHGMPSVQAAKSGICTMATTCWRSTGRRGTNTSCRVLM